MRIGILGSGLMGGKLGTLFARAGHEVVFSYARSQKKLEQARAGRREERAGRHAARGRRDADAVLLAVHWSRFGDVLKQAGDLSGKVLVTCSLPMNEDEHRARRGPHLVGRGGAGADGSEGPGRGGLSVRCPARCCSACTRPGARPAGRVSCTAATTRAAKPVAAGLIRDVGFDPVDAGPLRIARYTEPFALLVGQLAYEGAEGPELAYRFERFRQ